MLLAWHKVAASLLRVTFVASRRVSKHVLHSLAAQPDCLGPVFLRGLFMWLADWAECGANGVCVGVLLQEGEGVQVCLQSGSAGCTFSLSMPSFLCRLVFNKSVQVIRHCWLTECSILLTASKAI